MNKNTKQSIKNSFIWWIVFSITVLTFWLAYSAWTSITTVNSWDVLSSTKLNEIINRLNSINEKSLATAWVNFDGTSCTWWAWNECTIRDSYNINKVVRNTTWSFDLFFTINMDNTNYVTVWNIPYSWVAASVFNIWSQLNNKVNVNTGNYNVAYNSNLTLVQVFWWKTY